MLIVEDVMRKKVIFWNYYSWNFKYAEKKLLYEQLPPNVTPTLQIKKTNKITKDFLSNQYSIEPNRPATDLKIFLSIVVRILKKAQKRNSTWQNLSFPH